MFKSILFSFSVVSAAVIAKQVQVAMQSELPVPVLIQLKPVDDTIEIPVTSDSKLLSEKESNTNGKILASKLNIYAQETSKDVRVLLDKWAEKGVISPYRFYKISNTFAVEASAFLIEQLAQQSQVEEISSNKQIMIENKIQTDESDMINWSGENVHWSLKYINAVNLPDNIYKEAANLRYGNADSGVQYDHPALKLSYFGLKENNELDHNYAWWDASTNIINSNDPCDTKLKAPCDNNGHGSHTAGIVIGGFNLGVSPTSKWMACKNMVFGLGSPESYLGCLEFFLAPTDLSGKNPNPDLRPHVVGNSYACPEEEGCSKTTFKYALRAMKKAGIFMVASAGNDGEKGCGSIFMPPAIDPNIFTVAATKYQSNSRAQISSLGPVKNKNKLAIDLSAPGVNITSTVLNGGYASYRGSSMAVSHVAGAVLLITAACPHLARQVDQITNLLHLSATPVLPKLKCGGDNPTTIPNNELGYGILNVEKAIQLCRMIPNSS